MDEGAERRLRIAVVSQRVGTDVERNLHAMIEGIASAAAGGAEIACFPEYCLNPVFQHWIDLDPPILALRAACRKHRLWAVFGAESGRPGDRRDSVFLVDPDGVIRQRYDKVHLWAAERQVFRPGVAPSGVVDIGPCRLGLICCWDMAFPSDVADLANRGAELICCPSRLVDYELDDKPLRAIPLVRAFENLVYFVLCDAVSDDTLSESMICHPLGIRQSITRAEGILFADLDFDEIDDLRAYYRGRSLDVSKK
uniref:Predicted amidohydrolase n=1 Tax=Candidatus Kentrum sp. LPFa TaxID=2126335 RepID=A0A450VV40_9GAMM|nr:MAG: Predicted amidohydrolase [Candidatus Kentron sp. LPFa]VFK24884.1 MAG: Predicted amidohydrolase [Candidatus Kentron sp. LPFa]